MKKNTNRWFAKLFILTMTVIFGLTLASFLTDWGVTAYLSTAAGLLTAGALLVKLWNDNRNLQISLFKYLAFLISSVFLWSPFGVLLLIGFSGVKYVDKQLEQCILQIDQKVAKKISEVETINERIIQEDDSHWYNPFSWGKKVDIVIRERVVRQVIEEAPWTTRLAFGFIYSLIRSLQYLYYVTFSLIVVRSIGYFLARSAARRSDLFYFNLPNII